MVQLVHCSSRARFVSSAISPVPPRFCCFRAVLVGIGAAKVVNL